MKTPRLRLCALGVTVACTAGMAPALAEATPVTPEHRSHRCSPRVMPVTSTPEEKHRIVIMNDGEVDDMDSFIRYLYYANEFETEAIVLTSSIYHYAGDGKTVKPYRWTGTAWLPQYLDLYAKLYPNLRRHASGYPSPDRLRNLYKIGNIASVSDMAAPTEGSEAIRAVIMDADPRPVYFQAWGGLNSLARGLKSIEEQYRGTAQWAQVKKKVSEKVIVYNILNQDDTLNDYIRPMWPNIKVIDNQDQFWSFAYMWPDTVPAPNQYVLRAPWMESNLLDGTGALMDEYRTYRDGMPTPGDDENNRWRPEVSEDNENVGYDVHDFISEGDSPAYLHLLDFNGLRASTDPTWGGWGGRFAKTDTGWVDTTDRNPHTDADDRSYPLTRWIPDLQQDFAARVQWGVTRCYADANHAPVASVSGRLDRAVKAGSTVTLQARAQDPDRDDVHFRWWQYTDADTYPGTVTVSGAHSAAARVKVPRDAKPGQTIHLILKATDDGTPALKHYQRVVLTVRR